MKEREITYLIDDRDIMSKNADSNGITPTGDTINGFNKHYVPGNVTEADYNIAIRVAEELFIERLDYYEGINTELDYDDQTGDPIEIFDDDYEKMPVNYAVHIWNTETGKIFTVSVESIGIGLQDNYEGIIIDKILDMFELFKDLLILKSNKKISQDFYYKNYFYRIRSKYL